MEQSHFSADDMLLFAAIAEKGSVVRAAAQLGLPKATASRRLGRLEETLGQRLLVRTTRRMALTEFGREFLDHCRRVAEEISAAQDFARSRDGQPQGCLRVSMPEDYARHHLSRALATFSAAYPSIQLELDLGARRVDLIGERFDLAIRMGELADDSTLVARRIDEQRFGLYASPIYLGLHALPQQPDDLLHHLALRMLNSQGQPLAWRLSRGEAVWERVVPGRIALNSMAVIQQMLLDGAGIGALPERFAAADVRQGRLVRVLPEWSLPTVPAWAVMPMRRYLPAKTRLFLAHIEAALRQP